MVYGLPTDGEANWGTKVNASIEAVKTTADAAETEIAGRLSEANLTASYGREVSLAKHLSGVNVAQAFTNAATEAGVGGTVFIPKHLGALTLAAPVVLDSISLRSDGATILVPDGTTGPVITLTSANATQTVVEGFRLQGPGPRTLGVATAGCDGIKVTGDAKVTFRSVKVSQFDRGFDLNSNLGHLYFEHVDATNNYYGVYVSKNTFDYGFFYCEINGNAFANIACPADQGISGLVIYNSHVGYAPYGIYQEATPSNQGSNKQFLAEADLIHCRFEQIGNAAIWTDATQDGSNQSISGSLNITHPGFSWGAEANYRIAARPRTYAVRFTQTNRVISIDGGDYPFTSGDGGVSAPVRVELGGHSSFRLCHVGAVTTEVSLGSGNSRVAAFARPTEELLEPSGVDTLLSKLGASYWAPGSGAVTRRFGGDGSYLYADITSDLRFRNAGAGNALVGRVRTTDIIMPKYALGAAGASGGPTWSHGAGVPSASEPNGSMYSRTDGAAGSTLYVRVGGAWSAIA